MRTRQGRTDVLGAALFRIHPWADDQGRLVPHVLRVAALEVRHPVAVGVDLEARDGAGSHESLLTSFSFLFHFGERESSLVPACLNL
jgi:hypothetical protein